MTVLPYETPQARYKAQAVVLLKKLGPLMGLVLVVGLFAALRPSTFATFGNFQLILTQTAVVGTASLGMTMIIICGGIDLSVGSALALCTVAIAYALRANFPPLVAGLCSVAVGAGIGLALGLLVTYGRLIPFIVSLGFLGMVRGGAKLLAPYARVDAPTTWLTDLLNPFALHNPLLPVGVWMMLALALVVSGALHYTKFGRHLFAVGSNEQTARLCGVAVERTKLMAYVYAGALNGVAGVLLFSVLTMGDATSAAGYELNIIAAVVIGGTSLTGGEGTILGSLIGALFMSVIANGCTKVGLPNPWQEITTGGIIVLANAVDRLRHQKTE